ncbi:MAG: pyruvate formate lyase family protein [Candidatus Lokiarchaeota archaeon]
MQLKSFSSENYNKRISLMKENLIQAPFEICIERAKLITEFYKSTNELNPILRYAKALKYILTNMTIKIWDNELIVGNRCTKYKATPLYPEVRIDSIESDLETYDSRLVQSLELNESEKSILKNVVIPYWKNEAETVQERFISKLSPELITLMEKLIYIVDTELTNGIGHFFPGHENLLKYGINGLIKKTQTRLREFKSKENQNEDSQIFLKSVKLLLEGAKTFIKRFAVQTEELASKEKRTYRNEELIEISKICQNISEKPPESFKEALQLIYFNHLICGLEDGGFAISIGRLDQYLLPFYLKDVKNNKISDKEAFYLIQ